MKELKASLANMANSVAFWAKDYQTWPQKYNVAIQRGKMDLREVPGEVITSFLHLTGVNPRVSQHGVEFAREPYYSIFLTTIGGKLTNELVITYWDYHSKWWIDILVPAENISGYNGVLPLIIRGSNGYKFEYNTAETAQGTAILRQLLEGNVSRVDDVIAIVEAIGRKLVG